MTPEQLKAFFDGNAILLIFVWGLLCKYVPFMAKVPNVVIPWVGAIGYIIARFALPTEAHAAAGVGPDHVFVIGGILLGAFTNAVWARQLYEGFGKAVIERLFKVKKAV
jgi:hypothetical protein